MSAELRRIPPERMAPEPASAAVRAGGEDCAFEFLSPTRIVCSPCRDVPARQLKGGAPWEVSWP